MTLIGYVIIYTPYSLCAMKDMKYSIYSEVIAKFLLIVGGVCVSEDHIILKEGKTIHTVITKKFFISP